MSERQHKNNQLISGLWLTTILQLDADCTELGFTGGGALTLESCGATNDAREIRERGPPAAGRRGPKVCREASLTGSWASVRQEILEVGDIPPQGGNPCDDEIFLGKEP